MRVFCDARESLVKCDGKSPAALVFCASACSCDSQGVLEELRGYTKRASRRPLQRLLYAFLLGALAKLLLGRARSKKHVFCTPLGARKSCSRLGAVLFSRKQRCFSWSPSWHASRTHGKQFWTPFWASKATSGATWARTSRKKGTQKAPAKKQQKAKTRN